MKTIHLKFKIGMLLLFAGFALNSCSSDDDNNVDPDKGNQKKGHASAVIKADNQTTQFSSTTDKSYASLVKSKIEGKEIKQLVIVMVDDDSRLMIAAQVIPAPDSPFTYDLTKPLTDDYLFSTEVSLNGENSSEDNVYGVGSYQHDQEVVIQSSGSFKITSISGSTVKGTFEMTLYNTYDPDKAQNAQKLMVTKGSFELPIVRVGL